MRTLRSFELAVAFASYTFRSQSTLRRVHSMNFLFNTKCVLHPDKHSTLWPDNYESDYNPIHTPITCQWLRYPVGIHWVPTGYPHRSHTPALAVQGKGCPVDCRLDYRFDCRVSTGVCQLPAIDASLSMTKFEADPIRLNPHTILSDTHTLIQPRTDFDSISK